MIVECDRCATRYRVRDDKLPASGGNIKCPSCAHVFFVKPPSTAPGPSLGLRRASGPLGQDMDKTTGTTPSMLLGSTGAMSRPSTSGMSAAANADAGAGGWKLKTSFGLVYDFPNTDSLQAWLAGRDELTGYELAREGQAFKPLGEHSAILGTDIRAKITDAGESSSPSGLMMASSSEAAVGLSSGIKRSGASSSTPTPINNPPASKSSPALKAKAENSPGDQISGSSSPVPRSVSPVNLQARKVDAPKARKRAKSNVELEEQKRDQQDTRNIVIFSTIILLVVAVVVGLQFSGTVDFRKLAAAPPAPEAPKKAGRTIPKAASTESRRPAAQPGNANTAPPTVLRPRRPGEETDPMGVATGQHNEHVKMLLKQASEELRRKKPDDALRTLSNARAVAPTEPAVYRMLEQVYKKKGDSASAKQMRERYEFFVEQAKRQQKR